MNVDASMPVLSHCVCVNKYFHKALGPIHVWWNVCLITLVRLSTELVYCLNKQ